MTQLNFCVETLDHVATGIESAELLFLDDASYEYVGGGDAANGF